MDFLHTRHNIAESSCLYYIAQVTELLDHENVDVALAAVDLINELTDPEAIMEAEESEGAKVSLLLLVPSLMLPAVCCAISGGPATRSVQQLIRLC